MSKRLESVLERAFGREARRAGARLAGAAGLALLAAGCTGLVPGLPI